MAYEIQTEPQAVLPDVSARVMSYEEFLGWPGDNQHVEWVNGTVVFISPVTKPHEIIRGFLYLSLRQFVEARHLGQVFSGPFQMKTGPDLPGRAPDLFFVAGEHLERVRELYLEGPADLVIEIISPGSRATDRGDKFYEYEQGGRARILAARPRTQTGRVLPAGTGRHLPPRVAR